MGKLILKKNSIFRAHTKEEFKKLMRMVIFDFNQFPCAGCNDFCFAFVASRPPINALPVTIFFKFPI